MNYPSTTEDPIMKDVIHVRTEDGNEFSYKFFRGKWKLLSSKKFKTPEKPLIEALKELIKTYE